jgi:UPF0755 protein
MRNEGRWLAFLAAVSIGLIVAVAVVGWVRLHEAPPVPEGPAEPIEFRVEPGEGFARVAARLEKVGLVVSARRFEILGRIVGADREIRSGTFQFDPGTPPRDILDDLVAGNVMLLSFTVPEGWRVDQIAAEAESALGVSADEFVVVAGDSALRAELGCTSETLEGYLFPETYRFPVGVGARDVVDAMTRRFVAEWAALEGDPPAGLDRHGVVTLASIVEAETSIAEERPRVAAVYLNRLERKMRLQADPTVRYGIGRFHGRLYYKHLDIPSPYNTYRNHGLPPGAIAAPGRAALQAVFTPLDPCDDLYFVASGDGGHVFSRTKAEHDRAKHQARTR